MFSVVIVHTVREAFHMCHWRISVELSTISYVCSIFVTFLLANNFVVRCISFFYVLFVYEMKFPTRNYHILYYHATSLYEIKE